MALLETDKLVKSYRGRRVVDGVSFRVRPERGTVRLQGEECTREPMFRRARLGMGYLPQEPSVFRRMTVKDNLIVGAYNRRASQATEQTIQNVYELLPRLSEREDQLAMTLSGGEQQMVAIGRGLMAMPHLLMLDEPSLGLAPILIGSIFETVRKIADQGTTVLLVEQDVKHSLSLSDRGYVLEHGRVVMEGQAKDLMNDPHVKEAYLGI